MVKLPITKLKDNSGETFYVISFFQNRLKKKDQMFNMPSILLKNEKVK